MHVWRLTRASFRRKALQGTGARRFGGRWNSIGTALGYASSSLELAVLEATVHVRPEEWVGAADYWWIEFDIPPSAIEQLDRPPRGWDDPGPYQRRIQAIGDEWAASRTGLALIVPAAVLPERRNVLVNPAHERFRAIRRVASGRFTWPGRLAAYLDSLRHAGRAQAGHRPGSSGAGE